MEETERYGIELEAETSNFKKQMQDIINTTKKTAETIKNNLNISDAITFRDFETKIGTYNKQIKDLTKELDSLLIKQRNDEWGGKNNTFNAEIEETKNKIEMLGNSIDKINAKKIEILDYNQTTQHIEELEQKLRELKAELQEKEKASIWSVEQGEIEALKESIRQTSVELDLAREHFNKLEDLNLQQPIEEANEELSRFDMLILQIRSNFDGLGNKISTGFNKTIRSIKRLSLSLVGVHSAYFLISRAVSAYSQYDIEYTQKMKSAWASLGAFLAPLTSMLGTLMQKLVGYLNVFITALTGIDYVKKANEAYKFTKAIKDQNKALTAMDEITNISDNKENEDFNPFEAIQNVELDKNWVDKLTKLGKTVRKIYDEDIKPIIDKIWEFIKNMDEEDWKQLAEDLTAIGLAFLAWKIDPKLGIIVFTLTRLIQEFGEYIKKEKPTFEDFGKVLSWLGVFITSLVLIFGGWVPILVGGILAVVGVIITNFGKIKKLAKEIEKYLTEDLAQHIEDSLNTFEGFFTGVKQVADGIITIFKKDLPTGIKTALKGIGNILIGYLNLWINAINLFISPIRNVIANIGQMLGKKTNMSNVKIPNIPYLDKGTAYVEQDGLAMIHQGEAVIPKKFNSQEYFSNINNNETTNALLVELIQAVEENGDKVPVFNINGKEFAKATYNDIKNEGNRLNTNTIMRRV